ncbi:MAG: TetR family transcriptional regulator [Streptosporangiales bacterium]|nr:TetR family transcriptional regulator [Streptosporangiales bacterium]
MAESSERISARRSRRREEYAEATRNALVAAATELFAAKGYQGTSVEDVARRARVTRGALYHHFGSKQELFEAVFEEQETAMIRRAFAAVSAAGDPWTQALAALDVFLDACTEPRFRELTLRQAPVALGWERWRELDERFGRGLVHGLLRNLVDAGEIRPFPIELLSGTVFALLAETARHMATAPDQDQARADAREAVLALLAGLR